MNRFRRFGAALMIAGFITIGMSSTATVSASDGFAVSTSTICHLLASALSAAQSLPDRYRFKQALINYIQQEQVKFGCASN